MSDEKEKLTGHSYDGIEEFDNPLPAWWLITFFATIIFSGIYWLHYESGTAPTQLAELESDLAAIKSQSQSVQASQPAPVDSEESLGALIDDTSAQATGKEVFMSKCATCHGNEMQGMIGPNLVDNYWLHGGSLVNIMGVIRKGVLEKGMPAWESMLKENELKAIVAFIGANQGSKPPNPKAPQGEKFVRD